MDKNAEQIANAVALAICWILASAILGVLALLVLRALGHLLGWAVEAWSWL